MKVDFRKYLSYSCLNQYETCPRCWILHYKHGYQLPSSPALELGSKVHKILENYHKGKFPPKYHKDWLWLKNYMKVYKPEDRDVIDGKPAVEMKIYCEMYRPENPDEKLPLPFLVKVDKIWNSNIYDAKTSSHRYKQEEVDNRIQTALYAYAFKQKYPTLVKPEGVKVFYDVIIKKDLPELQPIEALLNEEGEANALSWVWNVWDRVISSEEAQAHSVFCPHKGILP